MSLNCTVSSLQFDNALLDEIKKSSGGDIKSKLKIHMVQEDFLGLN